MTEDMRERLLKLLEKARVKLLQHLTPSPKGHFRRATPDDVDWYMQFYRECEEVTAQAALSSAETSQPNAVGFPPFLGRCETHRGLHEIDILTCKGWIAVVEESAAGTSGTAEGSLFSDLVQLLRDCQEELRLIRMKDCGVVYDPTLRSRLHSFLSCVRGDSLSGKVAAAPPREEG